MIKYPIGLQDFRTLRADGYAYVDKTEQIHRLIATGKYYFLSRPRRFGKSLTVSTLHELFTGNRTPFAGLWVETRWDWARKYPVLWFRFGSSGFRTGGLESALHRLVDQEAERLGISLRETLFEQKFRELIRRAMETTGERVVLLIDEYDKPIVDYLEDLKKAEANRALLKSFYSVLKDSDPYLSFVFITGVSAFSKVSLFSDFNHMTNLTLSDEAADLVGITEAELDELIERDGRDFDRALVRRWYNGYSWDGQTRVYNPFSLLSYLKGQQLLNYWFGTGTPTFLIQEMKKRQYYHPQRVVATQQQLTRFNLEQLDPVAVLFQTGYLTVRERDIDRDYVLDYPNLEVEHALEELLLEEYLNHPFLGAADLKKGMATAVRTNDLNRVRATLDACFAEIPYEHWAKQDEHFVHAIIHLIFSLLGVYVTSKVHTANGRCDARVQTDTHIYVFEFKIDQTARRALNQIKRKGYFDGFSADERTKIGIGASFSTEEKRITDWKTRSF